jgi:hypothetical protein
MTVRQTVLISAAIACSGCGLFPSSTAPIIRDYRNATCIPFSEHPEVMPHTREWRTSLMLNDGSTTCTAYPDYYHLQSPDQSKNSQIARCSVNTTILDTYKWMPVGKSK